MKKSNLKNISRVEQEKKRQYGWLVRIMRDGVMYQRFFFDSVNNGKSSALLAAIAYRDEMLRKHPKPLHGNLFNRITKRNTSKHPGVSKTRTRKGDSYYEMWQASWTLPSGKTITKKFHFSPTGRSEKEARRLAIKAREEGVKQIERIRRGIKSKPKAGKKKS